MKKFLSITLVFLLFLSLSGCKSSSNIFDDSIPIEDTTTLAIYPELTVKSYNDIPVKLKTVALGFGATGFTIPAGVTTLILDLDTGSQRQNVRYRARDVPLTYNFEAGKKYMIRFAFADDEGNAPAMTMGRRYTPGILVHEGEFSRYIHKVELEF